MIYKSAYVGDVHAEFDRKNVVSNNFSDTFF